MKHSHHKTREYGRKLKKAESRTLRARDERAAIEESLDMTNCESCNKPTDHGRNCDECFDTRPEFGIDGFNRRQLRAAFDRVKNTEHWKGPVDALIHASERDAVEAAIGYFCGSIAEFAPVGNMLRVRAAGYWEDIGA